ncbi:hypothetical protein [Streptomyces sp. NPDC047000]|uniref:hypothetical protein n=1 Tax=Streptomyces sp. NPDC047000 TaxID=3155474 RepID=UPI0033F58D6C
MTSSGASPLSCAQLHECGAELALDVLPGPERSGAVAHLQHCAECRTYVRDLTPVADGLLDLVPAAEPPPGFDSRVLRRMGPPARPPWHRRHRIGRTLAAAAAAAALVLGGWAVGNASAPTTHPALRTAVLTAQERHVGKVYAHTGASPWLYVDLDAGAIADDPTVRCQVVRADGSVSTVGTFRLDDGYAHWGGPYPAGSSPVTTVRLLAPDGSVLAASDFHDTGASARPGDRHGALVGRTRGGGTIVATAR